MDELTLPRLEALYSYWRHHPPLHVLVAAYMGVKAPTKPADSSPATQQDNEAAIEAFINSQFPGIVSNV